MQIDLGAPVTTSDGKNAGRIKHLIVDTHTTDVRAMVIEKGFLFHTDREVGLDAVHSASDGAVVLSHTSKEVEQSPEFDPTKYEPVPPDYWSGEYAPGSLIWPAVYPMPGAPFGTAGYPLGASLSKEDSLRIISGEQMEPDTAEEVKLRAEQAAAIVEEGSAVYTVDGVHVGDVRTISLDSDTGHVTRLVLRQGWLVPRDFELPASTIAGIDDHLIRLNIDQDALAKIAGGDLIIT